MVEEAAILILLCRGKYLCQWKRFLDLAKCLRNNNLRWIFKISDSFGRGKQASLLFPVAITVLEFLYFDNCFGLIHKTHNFPIVPDYWHGVVSASWLCVCVFVCVCTQNHIDLTSIHSLCITFPNRRVKNSTHIKYSLVHQHVVKARRWGGNLNSKKKKKGLHELVSVIWLSENVDFPVAYHETTVHLDNDNSLTFPITILDK